MSPKQTDKLPSGGEWLHKIKHDGFRVIARKNGAQVSLYSRPGKAEEEPALFRVSAHWPMA